MRKYCNAIKKKKKNKRKNFKSKLDLLFHPTRNHIVISYSNIGTSSKFLIFSRKTSLRSSPPNFEAKYLKKGGTDSFLTMMSAQSKVCGL